jgi:glycosyltransferase involved in cell wall biosynthesis
MCTYDPALPNHRLTSPNKLGEALMLGKPLIVAAGTGVDQIVKEHRLGTVVSYGDADQLEQALAEIASWSADDRSEFAARGRRLYREKYSWAAMRDVFTEVLTSLAD